MLTLTCLAKGHFMSSESHVQDWFQYSYRCAIYSAVVLESSAYKSEICLIFSCKVPTMLLDLIEILCVFYHVSKNEMFPILCSYRYIVYCIHQMYSKHSTYRQVSWDMLSISYRSWVVLTKQNSTRNMQWNNWMGINLSVTCLLVRTEKRTFQKYEVAFFNIY